MDLCLKGSQINLATRQKTKPKSKKFTLTLSNSGPHYRPRSANFLQQRSATSPFLGRPQSADPKIGRKLSIYFSEKEGRNSQTLSSSELFKSLLEEPIKRSWLTRSAGNSSTDEQSDFTSQKSASINSVECEQYERFNRNVRQLNRMSSSVGNIGNEKASVYASAVSKRDYWPPPPLTTSTAKPDLPGRVSFSKPSGSHMHHELDSSDCENDKQMFEASPDKVISAPGPLVMPNLKPDSAGQKKTVHFGAAASDNDGTSVLAETYEYPKCPSENCTCSTRSSSTSSTTHEAGDVKCACDAPTCRYGLVTSAETTKTTTTITAYRQENVSGEVVSTASDELKVIREYKHAVGEQLENTIVKSLLEEGKPSSNPPSATVNSSVTTHNIEVPSYLEKYTAPKHSKDTVENKQNNLSESRHQYKPQPKRNLDGRENNLLPELPVVEQQRIHGSSSADVVINNYLKVASTTPPLVGKKKENIKPGSADVIRQTTLKPKPKPLAYNGATSTSSKQSSTTNGKLKKAKSIGSLRDETNLSEYNMDKIDSWMSVNQRKLSEGANKPLSGLIEDLEKFGKECFEHNSNADESGSQYSLKSDDNSQDSTYNEIVSVIKEIEEDKKRDNYAERVPSELELKLESRCETADTSSQCESKANDSPDKYKGMLAYLDNVENSCDKSLLSTCRSIPESNRTEIEFIVEPDITEDVPKLPDLLMLPNHQLARRVIALSLRANELANAIHLSKDHVIQLRNERQKLLRAEKASGASKLRDQKKHYEEVVKRHQGFIEQLLKDKSSLCEKVAALTRRLESQNQAWEHRLETEVTRAKETTLAGEKIRRERWVRENTKKIKELTVKGLEAEINKMNCDHQREITELKRTHQQQLLDAVDEARLKHEQIETTIREACAQDREAIIEKERAAIRERFERQLEEERNAHNEQKQMICEEFASERERLQEQLRQKDAEHQARRQEAQRENENELEQAKFELQEKMAKQEEKYQNRINTIEKQYLADFELWKREYENAAKVTQAEKENAIRQHYRAERDRQLDELVIRMESEALQCNEEHEQKMNRLKEKYEKDLAETENVERSLRDKYTETRTKLAESDAQARNFQAEIKRLEMELDHSKKMCDEFLSEREHIRERERSEVQGELEILLQKHNSEIETLHKRVQQTIGKKDAQIERLECDNGNMRERCLKLEAVIRQQRKDYCSK